MNDDAGPRPEPRLLQREVARYLRQRLEGGEGPLHLADLGGQALLEAASRGARWAPLEVPASGSARPGASAEEASPDTSVSFSAPPSGSLPGPSHPAPRASSSAMAGPALSDEVQTGRGEEGGGGAAQATPLPSTWPDLPSLATACRECTRCGLAATRTQVVVHDGIPESRVMVVGEAPGANEDATGRPFVGAAGKLLDLLLATVDLSRERDVYIANVLKCRPPGNRNPEAGEIATCSPWLRSQIALVRPRVLLAVGTFAGQFLSGRNEALGKLRGQSLNHEGIPLVVTYHPAALLRNSGWIVPTWEDLQRLRRILHEAP